VPSAILFVVGIIMLLERFTNIPIISQAGSQIRSWGIIIAAFALGVSAINLIQVHTRNMKLRRNTLYSLVLVASMAVTALLGIILGPSSSAYKAVYNSLLAPMSSAIYAMLAFYIASAAVRAFVARNVDATVLLASAVLVMIGNVPIGEIVYPNYRTISSWLLNIPNLAGQRGVMISASVGAVVTSLRVLIGIDQTHFGGI